MRLEEWQQYIESQFLELSAGAAHASESAAVTVSKEAIDLPAEADGMVRTEMVVEPRAVPRPTIAHMPRELPFSPIEDSSDTLPDFDRYLPATNRVRQSRIVQSLATEQPEPEPAAINPRKRGRRPRQAPPPSKAAAELEVARWIDVPRHIHTLLSLDRDAEEVAQSSYKRPFAETRRELIERLIDPVITLEEAARLLNVCPTTVRRYTNRGLLSHYRKEPVRGQSPEFDRETRQRRFRLSDILAFVETQSRPHGAAGQLSQGG